MKWAGCVIAPNSSEPKLHANIGRQGEKETLAWDEAMHLNEYGTPDRLSFNIIKNCSVEGLTSFWMCFYVFFYLQHVFQCIFLY